MGSQREMTEYEQRRLENIKRNGEMLAALKVRSKLNDLCAKRPSAESKSNKSISVKKTKTEAPVVLRQSLRARGVPPDSATANGLEKSCHIYVPKISPREQGPLRMKDTYRGDDMLDNRLVEIVSGYSGKVLLDESDSVHGSETSIIGKKSWGSVNTEAFQLKPENVARVFPGRIMSLRFFPIRDMQMIAVGNKFGDIGFWHVNGKGEDGDGIHLFHPHPGEVSGIVIDPSSISKVYSSCYGGFIRMLDVEKEVFDMLYYTKCCIYSISLSPHDTKALYFSEGMGEFNKWDLRAGKTSLTCNLHDQRRINTIDFNSEKENIMATSSSDGKACIWDLRLMKKDNLTPLKTVNHTRAVYGAYFSPSGKFLATTSLDDMVGLSSGENYEKTSMVHHKNHTGQGNSLSQLRGGWGWDDSSIYIGNVKRGVDVISVASEKVVATLQSNKMLANTCRFDPHPYNVGVLAGATIGGQVCIWTQQ